MPKSPELRAAIDSFLDAFDRGVLPIVQAGHPVLRQPAAVYDGQLDDLFPDLLHAMQLTMVDAPGVGLAAPQVGIGLALAVVADPGIADQSVADIRERTPLDFRVLVNPSYAAVGDERRSFYEGCLSVSGYQAVVARHRQVRLTGQDETGRELDEILTGWPARIIQHETDHLRGQLYLDHAEIRSLSTPENFTNYWGAAADPAQAAEILGFRLS